MSIQLVDTYLKGYISEDDLKTIAPQIALAHQTVIEHKGYGADFLGWVDLPVDYDKKEFARIKEAAKKIQKSCDILIVIGIGGSYLGARAAIEFVNSPIYNNLKKDTPDIYFAGNNISATSIQELLSICEGKDVCVNVISKSGTTTEPAIAFRIFREWIEKKYGEEGAKERIFVTTDESKGKLKELAVEKGYETFVIPGSVGGRFSVLTPVGLLPIAAAGIDIDEMMAGARDARALYTATADVKENPCCRYAAIRNLLYRKQKAIEIMVGYDPAVAMLAEWWKQLYGESEGKGHKGIFPASVIFSTDLHSLGQFIQDGTRNLFETVLDIRDTKLETIIPTDPANLDGLNFVAGKSMQEVNRQAFLATTIAHYDGGVPNIILEVENRSAATFGQLIYFFELGCAISGYTLGVNPFHQPGVEAYKTNMYALLGKPGEKFDALREELQKRIGK